MGMGAPSCPPPRHHPCAVYPAFPPALTCRCSRGGCRSRAGCRGGAHRGPHHRLGACGPGRSASPPDCSGRGWHRAPCPHAAASPPPPPSPAPSAHTTACHGTSFTCGTSTHPGTHPTPPNLGWGWHPLTMPHLGISTGPWHRPRHGGLTRWLLLPWPPRAAGRPGPNRAPAAPRPCRTVPRARCAALATLAEEHQCYQWSSHMATSPGVSPVSGSPVGTPRHQGCLACAIPPGSKASRWQ